MAQKENFFAKLDSTDLKLINLLQEDCMQPIKSLAQKLNLSIAPVHSRMRKLEAQGVIKRYVAIVDLDKVNKPLISYCRISLQKHDTRKFAKFEQAVKAMDEVLECYVVSGSADYLLKTITSDMDEYQNLVLNKLAKLGMIENINSQFVLKHLKFKTSINLK